MATPVQTKVNGEAHYQFDFKDSLPLGQAVVNAMYNASPLEVDEHITNIRLAAQTMQSSSDVDAKRAITNIDNNFKREIQDSMVPEWNVGPSVMGWLSEADIVSIGDFCHWNITRQVDHQSALDEITPMLQSQTRVKTSELIDMEFFPPGARKYMEVALRATNRIYALDSFEAGGNSATAYFRFGSNPKVARLGMSNLFVDPLNFSVVSDEHVQNTFHETMHAAGFLNNAGYILGVDQKLHEESNQLARWLEEVIVSHSQQVAYSRFPQPTILSPNQRTEKDELYVPELKFAHVFLETGPADMSIFDLVKGFFTPRHERSTLRTRLEEDLNYNLQYFFPEITDLYGFSEIYETAKFSDREGVMNQFTKRILDKRVDGIMGLPSERQDYMQAH